MNLVFVLIRTNCKMDLSFIDDHHVLAIGAGVTGFGIVISPKRYDEMGITAHILGNTHKLGLR